MINDLFTNLVDLQKSERVRVSAEAREWMETLKATKAALALVGLEDQPAAFSQSAAESIAQLPAMGLFNCQFLYKFLKGSKQTIRQSAIERIQAELQRRRDIAAQCKAEVEAADNQKTMTVSAAIQHKRQVVEDVNEQRAILNDRGDSIQQGCAGGLIIACVVLAGYLAYNIVLGAMGRSSAVSTPLNMLFLALFAIPVCVTLMAQMVHGTKRFMVESELKAKIRQASLLCEKAIEQAEDRFRNQEPSLKGKMKEAAASVDQAKEALKMLGVDPDLASTEPLPSDNV